MNKKGTIEIGGTKRFIAAVALAAYISALNPLSIFAVSPKKAEKHYVSKEEKAEAVISAKNGGVVSLGGASIEIPEGALKKDTKISITRLAKVADTGESLYNAIPKFGGYRFLPAGTKFEKEVTITLPYKKELNAKPQSLEEMYTYFYDTEKKSWVKLERLEVDKDSCVVRSLSTHFTDMINATLTLPESASPVDVNLNSIKNLEAAKPDGHLIKFNPPKASNMGDASFSFELGIPAGRRGMQPQISIGYSSGGGNGIVGKGFDVNYGSAVSTDTRLGLPNYDTRDSYMLDGILLSEKTRKGTTITYGPQKESSFDRIVRHNAGSDSDCWEVTDKGGTKRTYAQDPSSCTGGGRRTFTWNLTRTEDAHGNSVVYEYEKQNGYVYPTAIYYTGFGETKGNYNVRFHYDENGAQRQDVRIDARSTEIISCAKLLTSITTHYKDGGFIRKYQFSYNEGLAKEKMMNALSVTNNADDSYEYAFEYVEPQKDDKGNVIYFSEAEEWSNGQPLQTGNSTNIGAAFNSSTGIGYGTKFIDVRFTGGGSGSVSSGESYTENSLVDINGDGKLDAVSQDGNNVYVALNNGSGFDSKQTINIKSGSFDSDIDYEKNNSSTVGWNVYAGAGAISNALSLGVGYSEVHQKSSSNTLCSFLDMDRDGLVDIVETGKSTYLKNMGNLIFEKRNIYSNVAVKEVTQPLEPELAEKYDRTYFIQTPFRMWKTPYEGIISVTESANAIAENYDKNKQVIAKTFIGDSETDEPNLQIMVKSSDTVKTAKTGIDVNKGVNYYFITDNGQEPEKTDIKWDINIEYTDIKAFKTCLKHPFLDLHKYASLVMAEKNYSCGEEEALQDYKSYIISNYLENEVELAKLFVVSISKERSKNNSYEFVLKAAFDPNWMKKASAEEQKKILYILQSKHCLIPAVFTENQFNDYLTSVNDNASKATDVVKYYSDFALQFEHSITDNLYILRDFSGEEQLSIFLDTYPLPLKVQDDALANYNKNGIRPSFGAEEIAYEYSSSGQLDNIRAIERIGTSSDRIINIGKYNSSDLYIDLTDSKLKYSAISNGKFSLVETDISCEPFDLLMTDDSISVKYGINKDKNNVYESFIIITLTGKSYRATSLSKYEFQKIVDDIYIEFTDIYDPHWQLTDTDDETKRVKTTDMHILFDGMELSESQKNGIITALYDKKDAFRKVKMNAGENQGYEEQYIEEYAYSYYILKRNADYSKAQNILNEYKKEIIYKEKYPFYNNLDEIYFLKDEWKIFKEKEIARSEWISEIEAKIFENNSELKKNSPNEFSQKVNEEIEKKYQEYLKLNNFLLSECKKFNFGKYAEITFAQDFPVEHLYHIDGNSYSVIIANNDFNLQKTTFSIPKTEWNSSNDFSTENSNHEKVIFSYENTITQDDITVTETDEIVVANDEFLYGGKNNWFYGIWKGESFNIAFSQKTLRGFDKASEDIKSKEDFEEKKNSIPSEISDKEKNDHKDESAVYFYLPQKQSEIEITKDIAKLKNAAIFYNIDLSKSLLGTVSMNSEIIKTSNDRKTVTEYYMPFISADTIHVDRAGGISYYKVEGLKEETNSSMVQHPTGTTLLAMPTIRKSHTQATDRTPTAKAGIGPVSVDFSKTSNSNSAKDSYNLAISLPGASGSVGENNSTSTAQQIIQDVNSDGIPDIVQIDNGLLRIIAGTKLNEDGEICFNHSSELSGISFLSKNETSTKVYGGSVSAQGAVKQVAQITPYGNIRKVIVEPQATSSASGGLTYSISNSRQTHGIGDINGDGLPDYYNGNFYALNNGSMFTKDYTGFSLDVFSKSNSQSIGTNFSVGIGVVTGKADLYSAKNLRSGANGTIGITYNSTSSNTEKMLLDINGDGLQDILEMKPGSSEITVNYNIGNGFIQGTSIALPDWKNYVSGNYEKFLTQADSDGFDLGLIGDIPVIGSAASKGLTKISINPFGFNADKFANSLDWNTNVTLGMSGNIGANVNIGIDIWATFIYCGTINITMSCGAGVNTSTSINGATVKMMDLDGDGLADHVLRIPGYGTYWKRNISGRYGQLAKVRLPQGGSVRIEYAEKYGTTDNPNFKYVMSGVTAHDGCGETLPEIPHGAHSVTTKYEYENAYYDRQKKDFYGFATVRTEHADGTRLVEEYHNRDYYAKGCPKESRLHAKDGTLLSESRTELCDAPHALPAKEESRTYEKSSGNAESIRTATEYEYDGFGNCVEIRQDFGGGEILIGEVAYDNTNTTDYIVGLPVDIRVYDSNGTLLRRRSGSYDEFGELAELRQYFDAYNHSVNTLKYDKYGNISSVSDSRGATTAYAYDKDENMLVTEIAQSGSGTDTYKSHIAYDIATQTKKSETDCNGNTLRYEHDGWQRIAKIFTSYDGATPAVGYEYFTPKNGADGLHEPWHAVTNNKVTFDADDTSIITTVLQIDGLGRAVRTAKTGFVNGVDGWNASGAVEYDKKGRTIKEGMTEFIQGGMEDLLASVPRMTSLFTSYEYDEKDRQTKTTLPDGSVQENFFHIERNRLITETADPLGNVSVQETDSRGNVARVAKKDSTGRQLTEATYRYSAMGEMLEARDAKGHPIKAEYDMLGRRTALESPDGGRQEFAYDECSNLARETSSVLRGRSKQILYEYDGLNRLVRVDYPDTVDTLYTYGGSNAPHGAAGKILRVDDASGTLEYEYGRLGEVTKETRTLNTHLNGLNATETATTEYRSDYLGRMQHIVYPDGENVSYGYDAGGQVVSVTGSHWGHEFKYVTNILYDEYGQRTRIDYGNGTFTEYSYDPARRWLDSIKTQNKWGQCYQNISYGFDAVGNVLGYENDCLDNASGNYKTRQSYGYDNLYQLIKVSGSTIYNPYRSAVPEFVSDYSQIFEFDSDGLGNMTGKISTETVSPQKFIGDNLNYQFDYVYDKNYEHRLVRAGDRFYQYDENGNVVCEQDGSFDDNGDDIAYHKITREAEDVYSTDYGWGLFKNEDESGHGASAPRYRRTYTWDEKNRLISSVDSNYSTAYVYGQDGQRSNKYTQSSETLYFNKMWTLHTDSGNNVYGGQYAKNIYLGETRIVTKLNSGSSPTYQEEYYKQYFYHSDHLGSASLISDYKGDEYQRIEYTPYGETWVEKTSNTGLEFLPYKFTAKELDKETGLYYYGARYLDPKYSRWISADPALGEYMQGSSAGEGGIYNGINLSLYHYGGNNPIRYTDPTGAFDWDTNTIESGDTLSQIANDCNTRYGTNYTADDLQGLNSGTISDKDKIYAGNHLNLGKAEVVQKRAADYTNRATTQYSNEQMTSINVTFVEHINVGVSLKAAVIGGLGLELGVSIDTNKNIGLYGTFYRGIGVQVGDGGSTTNVAKFLFNLMFGGGMSWSPGDIYSNNGSAFTADGGAGVLGTWDLKNGNNRLGPLQTSGFGGFGVGGAIWWSNTGVLPIKRGKK